MCGSRVPRRFRFGPLIRRMDLPILCGLVSIGGVGMILDSIWGSVKLKYLILGDEIKM